MRFAVPLVLAALCVVAGLPGFVSAQDQLSGCDPLDPSRCYLPYPNDFWLRENSNGDRRLALTTDTVPQPKGAGTIPVDPMAGGWGDSDGFPPITSILTYFEDISLDNSAVPRIWNVESSLDPKSPTVLINTKTGDIEPHYVELDHRSDPDFPGGVGYDRAFMLWPTRALENGVRYIVAVRNLQKNDGTQIPTSKAFQSLRDNTPSSDPDVELRRDHFNKDIFPALESVGFTRDSTLQLAWDFTVASQQNIQARLLHIRDDALRRVGSEGPKYTVWNVDDNYKPGVIARRVQGTMQVPVYLTKNGAPNSSFVLDTNGMPVFQGYANANFTVLVPQSLVTNGTTGSALQYGHGLFGSQREVQSGYLEDEANREGYVLIAVDWWGLDENDAIYVALMLGFDITRFKIVPDRCSQGVVNALLSMRLLRGALSQSKYLTFNDVPVLDENSPAFYYGNSQGGILGAVYMAVTTDVERGTLGVPGGPYSLLLPRSVDFNTLWDGIAPKYSDAIDRMFLFPFLQTLWDRADPGGYMSWIINPAPGTPNHNVLIHYSVGDAQVTYLGAYAIGRSVGAVMFESNAKEANQTTFGFPYISDTDISDGPLISGWEYPGVPAVPQMNVPPPKKFDTHGDTRKQASAQTQMATFFKAGKIVNTCGGTCKGTQ